MTHTYECDICRKRYLTADEAVFCHYHHDVYMERRDRWLMVFASLAATAILIAALIGATRA